MSAYSMQKMWTFLAYWGVFVPLPPDPPLRTGLSLADKKTFCCILGLNKYEWTIDQELADAAAYARRRADASLGNSNDVMAAILKLKVLTQIRLSIDVMWLKNNPVKFHPDPIWNDGASDIFEDKWR